MLKTGIDVLVLKNLVKVFNVVENRSKISRMGLGLNKYRIFIK